MHCFVDGRINKWLWQETAGIEVNLAVDDPHFIQIERYSLVRTFIYGNSTRRIGSAMPELKCKSISLIVANLTANSRIIDYRV